jgi:hypothetical protein
MSELLEKGFLGWYNAVVNVANNMYIVGNEKGNFYETKL